MTIFQFKSFSFINHAIKRIVKHIKSNAKKQCFLVNLTNTTFWKDTPRGQEILEFFKGMTNSQTIEFLGLFDIFVVGFHNGINAYVEMTADPLSRNFEKTLWVSISKGYNHFSENFSGRATPLGDLRSSIGSPSPASGFQDSSVGSSFQQRFSTFEAGPATQPFSPFQCVGGPATQPVSPFQCVGGPATQPVSPFQGFGGPASGFSLFSAQPPSFGGYFQPIAQGGPTNPFILQKDFIPVQETREHIRQGQPRLKIIKRRIVPVEIPSGFSSGPSTSSTVGISKSPKAQTPIATTIANLEKKIARLKGKKPAEGSLDHSELRFAKAKLEKYKTR
jgi:hypothetical protein